MENTALYKKTPITIKISLVFFIGLLFLEIGMINSDYYTNITYIIFYIWFLSCFLAKPKAVVSIFNQKHYFALLLFLIYYFIGRLLSFGFFTSLKGTAAFVQYLSPIFIYEFYRKFLDKITAGRLMLVITGIYVFFSVKAILYLNINPMAARDMVSVGISETVMIGGGYSLAYGFAILIPIFLYVFIDYKNLAVNTSLNSKLAKLIVLTLITIFVTVIIKSMFAISFLLLLVGCIYVAFLNIKSTKNRLKIIFYTLCFVAIFLITKDYIFKFLINYLSTLGNTLSNKLLMLINLSDSNYVGDTESMGERFSLYGESFNTWINNFIFGIGNKYGFEGSRLLAAGLGEHSEWFDLLAIHGLMTFLLLYYMFSSKKVYYKHMGLKIALPILLVLGIINPVHLFNIYFVTFFFAPTLFDYFKFPDRKPKTNIQLT